MLQLLSEREIDDWVVTGCGDSLFAGVCAEVWFAQLAARRLRAVPAMQLSREIYEGLSPRSIVFAVSHSGTTARVIEAVRAAHSRGALVIAVTANGASELARSADFCLNNSVVDERSNCRTASFQAVLLLMRMIAEALAAADGRATRPFEPASLEPYIQESRRQVDRLSDHALHGDHWIFTGSGLGLGAAEYGSAKVYEAASLPAHSVELEQFIGSWDVLDRSQQTLIGYAGAALGHGATLGKRIWRCDLRIRLNIGPLDAVQRDRCLPNGGIARGIKQMLQRFGMTNLDCEVRLLLKPECIRPAVLTASGPAPDRLGWGSFLAAVP
ncbi:MAG: type VI secretion system baseplate subunit TssG, partial [Pseudonocardiales bacterium]